jgi:hypothetical protein
VFRCALPSPTTHLSATTMRDLSTQELPSTTAGLAQAKGFCSVKLTPAADWLLVLHAPARVFCALKPAKEPNGNTTTAQPHAKPTSASRTRHIHSV